MATNLKNIGEFGLIDKIAQWVGEGKDVVRGIGDDAAVLRHTRKKYRLVTTDMLIEGIHFKLNEVTPYLIGRKALAVNISDIAAMGGIPRYATVTIGAPASLAVAYVQKLYQGIKRLADRYGVAIIGGDTSKSDKLILTISMLGEVEKRNLALRSGAQKGDCILVTGRLGGSYPSRRHLTFTPRVTEARYLVTNFKIHAMIDISDGLSSDLTRIIEASRCGAQLEAQRIPVSANCTMNNALCDGEDYELLCTTSESEATAILKKWPYRTKLTKIGTITGSKKTIAVRTKQGAMKIPEKGFRHF
jgi:thiamine-monophosphate kinase